jgi:hypothetical protein
MRQDPNFVYTSPDDKFFYDVRTQRVITELRCKKRELEIIDDIAALNAERFYVAIRASLELGQEGIKNQQRANVADFQAFFKPVDYRKIYSVAEQLSNAVKKDKPNHFARNVLALISTKYDFHDVRILFD